MPPPEPRSRTVSPGISFASAVGLPQPREARRAASGTEPASPAPYRLEVIGSQPWMLDAGLVPQQAESSPIEARVAAAPYFPFTTSLMLSEPILSPSLCNRDDVFWSDDSISGTALRIKEAEQFLQRIRIGAIPEVGSIPTYCDQILILELVEMMRKRRVRNL